MTRTPDEIKKGMECCVIGPSAHQPKCGECPYKLAIACSDELLNDASRLVQQKEQENAEQADRIQQLEAERDAAVADLEHVKDCDSCKYDNACLTGKKDCFGCHEKSCPCLTCQYEWRGVQKEE